MTMIRQHGGSHDRGDAESPSSPVFMIGTERSGSNLLRVMLNAHPDLAVPHPPHVMRYFGPMEHRYGDLEQRENRRRLAGDVLRLVRAHIYPWTVPLDEDALVRDARPRDLFGIYLALYQQYAAAVGKRRWCCKSTFMIDHVSRILTHCPDARLIWLVRDPRDVALSSRRSVFNPCHPYHTAMLWTRQQEQGLRFETNLAPECLLRVHYEQLVTAPRQTLETICRFIGVAYHPGMLQFFDTDEARKSANLSADWANTGSPILGGNVRKYRGQMSARDVEIVERVAGETMRGLGYEAAAGRHGKPVNRTRQLVFALEGGVLRLGVESRSLWRDRNAWRRWHRAVTLMSIELRLQLFGQRARSGRVQAARAPMERASRQETNLKSRNT